MSLTRNQWLDMWAAAKSMEKEIREIKLAARLYGPFRGAHLRNVAQSMQIQVDKIKRDIESVIGQME